MPRRPKPVPPEVLRAFGFKKTKRRKSGPMSIFTEGTYYNEELELYYDPARHTLKQFADNLVGAVVHELGKTVATGLYYQTPKLRSSK
jgi:hypothetical protein